MKSEIAKKAHEIRTSYNFHSHINFVTIVSNIV